MRSINWFIISGIMIFLISEPIFCASGLLNNHVEVSDKALEEFYAQYHDDLIDLAYQMDAENTEVEESTEEESPAESSEESSPDSEETSADDDKSDEKVSAEAPTTGVSAPEKKEAAPQPPAPTPAAQVAKEPTSDDIVGIDTVDLSDPAGNWLYKRIWWERAQSRYEQIQGVFDQILEMRMPFFKRRAEIDRQVLEPFYVNVGLDQAEMVGVLTKLNTLLDLEREKHKSLDERDRKMLDKILEDKKNLEQLHKDVAALAKYDDALDEALNKLEEQVNVARGNTKQAWKAYKDIGKELNDKRARELYYTMDTYLKNTTNVAQYIQGIFKQHFGQVDKTIQDNASRIKEGLQALKEKGVDLREYTNKLDEKIKKEDTKEVEVVVEEPEEEGIMNTLGSWWQSFLDMLSSGYNWITSLFTGTSESSDEEVEVVQEPAKMVVQVEEDSAEKA